MKGIDELKEGVDYAALGGGFYKFLSLKKLGRFAEENKDRLIPVHFEQLLMDSLGAINLDGILVLFHEK